MRPPRGILMGEVGVGKSTAVASALASSGDWFFLLTNASALERHVALDGSMPPHKVWTRYRDDDIEMQVDTPKQLSSLLRSWYERTRAGKNQFRGIVIDEGTALLEWIDDYYSARTRDHYAAIRKTKLAATHLEGILRKAESGLIMVSHFRPATYEENPDSPRFGELKYPAGPDFPIGTMIRKFCRELDFVWQMEAQDTETTILRTRSGSPDVLLKSRGFAELEAEESRSFNECIRSGLYVV